jgi:hypothetical protein
MRFSGAFDSAALGQLPAMRRAEVIARTCAGASVVPEARLRGVRPELNLASGTSHVSII